jgi:DNA-binding NtrC family response regulator
VSASTHVLVVDDERFVRESLSELLRHEGFRVDAASDVKRALELLASKRIDVIVSDLSMPGRGGAELLVESRGRTPPVPVVLVTGVGTVSDAVAAMKSGAFDFLQKPVDPDELVLVVRRAAEHKALVSEVHALRERVKGLGRTARLVGGSSAMARVREAIAKVAKSRTSVLIRGESGTGKELAAEEIHRQSDRASEALVRVDCAASDAEAFESELFGQRRGTAPAIEERAGRIALADGGTLLLDAVELLRPTAQARLNRVLETGEYQLAGDERVRMSDVRAIAISNVDLAERVKNGAFRSDLYYRLAVFPLEMPPLRARKEDIPEIAAHLRGNDRALANEALEVLASYDWPGNVRELSNVLERARIVAGDAALDAELLRTILESAAPVASSGASRDLNLRGNLDAREKQILLQALERSRGKKKEAANLLGIDARNLGYYLRKHRINESSSES